MSKPDGISRRNLLLAGVGCAFYAKPAMAAAGSPVVVELFTSQGCSSCPPADAFLSELAGQKGVMALTYHVDYWDYLGWKDTFGSKDCSQRQYDYADARGDMDVYTPQIVVHGGGHFVGSNRDAVGNAIATLEGAPPVPVSVRVEGSEVIVETGAGVVDGDAMLWIMAVTSEAKVKILKGEIAGQEITYHNIVRKIVPAGMWHGTALRTDLPKDAIMTEGVDSCAAILQKGKAGPILGCAGWGRIAA